jgi:hypothetical protein
VANLPPKAFGIHSDPHRFDDVWHVLLARYPMRQTPLRPVGFGSAQREPTANKVRAVESAEPRSPHGMKRPPRFRLKSFSHFLQAVRSEAGERPMLRFRNAFSPRTVP